MSHDTDAPLPLGRSARRLLGLLLPSVVAVVCPVGLAACAASPQTAHMGTTGPTQTKPAGGAGEELRQQVRDWADTTGPYHTEMNNDFVEFKTGVQDQALDRMATACKKLESDTAKAAAIPIPPLPELQQYMTDGYTQYAQAARDCVAALTSNDLVMMQNSVKEMVAASNSVSKASNVIRANT